MAKMTAETPDVIAFNGYANQYKSAADHRQARRADPHVRAQRRPEQVERLPRHRHRLRPHRRRGHGRPRLADDEPRPVAGRLGRVHARRRRATTRSSPTPSATWSRARPASCTPRRRPHWPKAAAPAQTHATGARASVSRSATCGSRPRPRRRRPARSPSTSPTPGATMHQFAIGADPLTLDGDEPAASAAIAKGEMLAHRRHRDRDRRPQARQVRPLLPDGRPLRRRPEAALHGHRVHKRSAALTSLSHDHHHAPDVARRTSPRRLRLRSFPRWRVK